MKQKLSLVMLRNMDRLRSQGVFVQGSWINKDILILKDTSTIHSVPRSPSSGDDHGFKSAADEGITDSFLNIELQNLAAQTHANANSRITNAKDLMGPAYQQRSGKVKPGTVIIKPKGLLKGRNPRAVSSKKKVEPCRYHNVKGKHGETGGNDD